MDKKIRALSGGEKSRLAMARMLYNPPNFLVLDEPTNHLDLATKEMLVEALKDFEGTMIFVSHDRMFLRGLGSRVLELGGESGTDRNPRGLSGLVRRVRAGAGARGAGNLSLTARGNPPQEQPLTEAREFPSLRVTEVDLFLGLSNRPISEGVRDDSRARLQFTCEPWTKFQINLRQQKQRDDGVRLEVRHK